MSSNTYFNYILSWFWKSDDKVIDNKKLNNESNKLFDFPAGYDKGVLGAMVARDYTGNTKYNDKFE